ncbi:hypothetical protein LZ30DRAFT_132113 [Colletotrichum cereale]|nr:hypothetical protein LZ30DRAFT_132113 [Colletotrichum cereale]
MGCRPPSFGRLISGNAVGVIGHTDGDRRHGQIVGEPYHTTSSTSPSRFFSVPHQTCVSAVDTASPPRDRGTANGIRLDEAEVLATTRVVVGPPERTAEHPLLSSLQIRGLLSSPAPCPCPSPISPRSLCRLHFGRRLDLPSVVPRTRRYSCLVEIVRQRRNDAKAARAVGVSDDDCLEKRRKGPTTPTFSTTRAHAKDQ